MSMILTWFFLQFALHICICLTRYHHHTMYVWYDGDDYNVIIIIMVLFYPSSRFMCKYFPLLTIFLQQRSIGFHNCLIFLKLTKFDCSVREEKSKYSIKHFFNLNGSLRVLHCISSLKSLRKLERIVTLLNCFLSIPYRSFSLRFEWK